MKVIAVFILFFSMMFSLEIYLNELEKDIQESSIKEHNIVVHNTSYIELASWFKPFQF